jgi:hypothetical protein
MSTTIENRLLAAGLAVPAEDLPKLASLMSDMDRLALDLRGPRPYAEEPLSAFRLNRG